jgi:predicted dehydrogenase
LKKTLFELNSVMTTNSGKDLPKASATVKVAVVGLGYMGVTHLRVYLGMPSARIVAVCDAVRLPVGGVLQGVAGNVKKTDDIHLGPHVKVARKLEQVLEDPEIDLVDLCTPTPLHAEQAIAALKAGKNVLCEKPLARTSASAREILKVAESSPGFLMPAMCMRFWPGWRWLKQTVQQGAYGNVLAARFRRVSERPTWSQQGTYSGGMDLGGALFDLHIHDADFVQFLCGRPKGVFSTGVKDAAGTIDHVVTQYIYPGGPAVYAEGSWLQTTGFNMAFTIFCQRATLEFDFAQTANTVRISEPGQATRSIQGDEADGYSAEIGYFLECVASRRPPAIVTAHDGMTALEICEAEEKSLRTLSAVQL